MPISTVVEILEYKRACYRVIASDGRVGWLRARDLPVHAEMLTEFWVMRTKKMELLYEDLLKFEQRKAQIPPLQL